MRGTSRAAKGAVVAEPDWAQKSDYSAQAWRNRVKAARIKVDIDRRLGKPTPDWVRELAQEEIPDVQRPTRRRGSAA